MFFPAFAYQGLEPKHDPYPQCPHCPCEWHGLPNELTNCPGSEGPVNASSEAT